jgi:transposase
LHNGCVREKAVENGRTLAWLHRFRRLALRYERRADVHEAFLTLGCALITWRYLKREF